MKGKSSTEQKKEIAEYIQKLCKTNKEIDLKRTIAAISIETGFSKETVTNIFNNLEEAEYIFVDSKGKVKLSMFSPYYERENFDKVEQSTSETD